MAPGDGALGDLVRSRFDVDDSTVSAIGPSGELSARSEERRRAWQASIGDDRSSPIERLVPHIDRAITRTRPAFHARQRGHLELTSEQIKDKVDELAPWHVPFSLGHGRVTVRDPKQAAAYEERLLFRRDLINGTLEDMFGDELGSLTALDIGCNCGFFSLDLASRGAAQVDGIDLRPENVAQAQFLAEHYGIDNVTFRTLDAAELEPGRRWDLVLNLGVLYHVTEPLQFVRRTYELCGRAAVIDTVCHREPVSAFFMVADRDVVSHAEGRESMELLPTYRAVVDTVRYAGFRDVIELTGHCERPHPSYAQATRRCFLCVK